jgi:hypothetical protein
MPRRVVEVTDVMRVMVHARLELYLGAVLHGE